MVVHGCSIPYLEKNESAFFILSKLTFRLLYDDIDANCDLLIEQGPPIDHGYHFAAAARATVRL